MADNVVVSNAPASSNSDIQVRTTETAGGKQIQHVRLDLGSGSGESQAVGFIPTSSLQLTLRYDEAATYTYVGEAAAGALTSQAVWRIKRITNADNTIVWAGGDTGFSNEWDDRTGLTYS